jgi:hypothetical protein
VQQAHALQQIDVAQIGTERIHRLSDFDLLQVRCLLGICFLQPVENLIVGAKFRLRVCDIGGINIVALSQLLVKLDDAVEGGAEATLCVNSGCFFRDG